MTRSRQTATLAALATVGALLFAFSVVALALDLSNSIGENKGRSIGVTFTFDKEQCVGGNVAASFSRCRWSGTSRDGAAVLATDVTYVDTLPPDIAVGKQISALWSSLNPTQAWSVDTARAWLNSISAFLVSSIMLVILGATAIIWWRRYAEESKAHRAQQSPSEGGRERSEIS